MKRIFIIVGILVAAVAIVTIGMLLRGGIGGAPEGPAGTPSTGGTLPIVGTGGTGAGSGGGNGGGSVIPGNVPAGGGLPNAGVSVVAQAAVIDYAVNSQGVIFMASNGAVISPSSSEAIGQANFGDILGASFSPDGKWLLVKSGSSDFVRWSLLDVTKKTWKDIQANTSEMYWAPNSSQLAFFARRTNGSALSAYFPATNLTKALLSLAAPDLNLRWKDSSHIFLLDRPSSLVTGAVWEFAMPGATLTSFATNAAGADVLWGGARSGGLLFKAGPTGGTLALVNSGGNTIQSASFLTLPSKCVFGESAATSTILNIVDFLFCAIPQDQATLKDSQLPDAYLMGEFGTVDTIYAIGLLGGAFKPVLPASQGFSFDAKNLKVYGDSLYFVNRNDQKLYRVPLSVLEGATEEGAGG